MDAAWRHFIAEIGPEPKLLDVARRGGLDTKLSELSRKLDDIRNNLSEYINLKRCHFSRLYFLSDKEVLELLVRAKNGMGDVEQQICKLFPGMNKFYEEGTKIIGVTSSQEEKLSFVNFIDSLVSNSKMIAIFSLKET